VPLASSGRDETATIGSPVIAPNSSALGDARASSALKAGGDACQCYADINERDHQALVDAAASGNVAVQTGL
jgi:hypothetical protein